MRVVRDKAIESEVKRIVETLGITYIDVNRVRVVRSYGSKSKAYARIWGLPKPLRVGLDMEVFYVIEIISESFETLPQEEKLKTLIHEILHIPANFSGGLRTHGKYVNRRKVDQLFKIFVQRNEGVERHEEL